MVQGLVLQVVMVPKINHVSFMSPNSIPSWREQQIVQQLLRKGSEMAESDSLRGPEKEKVPHPTLRPKAQFSL